MNKSTHKENLTQPLQIDNKQFEIAVNFLTGYNGIFSVINENNKFYFTVSINDVNFNQRNIPLVAHEIESLNNKIKRNIIKEVYFTRANYPFKIQRNFSTLGSVIQSSSNITGSQIVFEIS